jgi:hypothetical protein
MRRVQKVVGHVKIVAIKRHAVAAIQPPGRIAPMVHIENQRRIGLVSIAHPDPHQAVAFMDRIGTDASHMRDLLDTRHPGAGAGAVKGQAMIATFDHIPLDAPHRQRQLAMRAGVLKGGNAAVGLAVKHDGLAQHLYREQVLANLVVPCGDIPAVAKIHEVLPDRISDPLATPPGPDDKALASTIYFRKTKPKTKGADLCNACPQCAHFRLSKRLAALVVPRPRRQNSA